MKIAAEYPPPGEDQYIESLGIRLKQKIIHDNANDIMRRDAHPKMHGAVTAEFIVEPDLPEELRIGVFKEAKTYRAWIRFSNAEGTIQHDKKPDIRGMAIKLMGVAGTKLLEDEIDEQTQDFLLISTNVFVTQDVQEFDELIKAFTGSIWQIAVFVLTHWRVGWNLMRSLKRAANPLQIRYWSTTPYLFGERAVKYTAIPLTTSSDNVPANPDPDYLRLAMIRQLEHGEVCFDFAVQFQVDPVKMPIEDPGHDWDESLSPFQKVARIRIPTQQFDSEKQRRFGENLSFTPWHSLPEHRPLGGINRARRVVYRAISMFRHVKNNEPRNEPVDWEME